MIVALAGGVGGAKLAHGLALAMPASTLAVVVNTADDFDLYGLRVCPDLDTVLYTLAGLANPATGWGIRDDTRRTLHAIARYGREPWFLVGDQDFATHILRTERLSAGVSLTDVMAELAQALGVGVSLLPMTDDPVATLVDTPNGRLAFQDYFVRRRQQDEVEAVTFDGANSARLPTAVGVALDAAQVIVICPSNPIVSVGPILAVPGMRDRLKQVAAPKVAVSPIIGGRALKGPADRMLASLGHDVSALGVAKLYRGLVDGMVIDRQDRTLEAPIAALGIQVLVTQTVMADAADRERLAREVINFAEAIAEPRPKAPRDATASATAREDIA